jgi:hypothetical protein
MGFSSGRRAALRSWMSFVDGENLTMRAQELAKAPKYNVVLQEGPFYRKDVFIWLPNCRAGHVLGLTIPPIEPDATRASYYTSLTCDYPTIDVTRDALRKLGFSAEVFKRQRDGVKAKGVDIALSRRTC